jgi:hypothetical protein
LFDDLCLVVDVNSIDQNSMNQDSICLLQNLRFCAQDR